MVIKVCVGSSCHLKGSPDIVEFLQKALEEKHLNEEVTLAGSFCIGKCNRVGVTVQIDDDIHVGITKENVKEYYHYGDGTIIMTFPYSLGEAEKLPAQNWKYHGGMNGRDTIK